MKKQKPELLGRGLNARTDKDAFNKAKDTASGVKDASSGLFKGRGKKE